LDTQPDRCLSQEARKTSFSTPKPASILFHSGYLTIDRRWTATEEIPGTKETNTYYSFRLPNSEVRNSCKEFFFSTLFKSQDSNYNCFRLKFLEALPDRDCKAIAKLFHDLPAGEACDHHISREDFYHALISAALRVAGTEIISEVRSSRRRVDTAALLNAEERLIIEVKHRHQRLDHSGEDSYKILTEALDEALAAIKNAAYAAPFRLPPKKITGLGVAVCGRDLFKVGFVEQSELNVIHEQEISNVSQSSETSAEDYYLGG
jgi:hypothetical protein